MTPPAASDRGGRVGLQRHTRSSGWRAFSNPWLGRWSLANIHRIVLLKCMHLTMCKLYLDKVYFSKWKKRKSTNDSKARLRMPAPRPDCPVSFTSMAPWVSPNLLPQPPWLQTPASKAWVRKEVPRAPPWHRVRDPQTSPSHTGAEAQPPRRAHCHLTKDCQTAGLKSLWF